MRGFFAFFCLLIGISTAHSAFSQTQPTEGYIVTNQGDTLRGFIDNQDWDKSPSTISFSLQKGGPYESYTVADATAFYLKAPNLFFVSCKATLQQISDDIHNERLIVSNELVHAFVQVLLSGPGASLYQLTDSKQKKHYLLNKDQKIIELINNPYKIKRAGTIYEEAGDLYKQQLQTYCSDASAFRANNFPGYNAEGLKTYFRKYNACFTGPIITYESVKEKAKFDIAPSVGLQLMSREGPQDVEQLIKPSFGIIVRVSLPKNHYNRFVRVSYHINTGIRNYEYRNGSQVLVPAKSRTFAFGGGSYFGTRAMRPYAYVTYQLFHVDKTPSGGIFMGVGFSLRRALDLEINGLRAGIFRRKENDISTGPGFRLTLYLPEFLRH